MPELPEVETVVRGLRPLLTGRTFIRVDNHAPSTSVVMSPAFGGRTFEEVVAGRTVLGITRRGKNILIALSGGVTLWVHLKMTGRFRFTPADEPRDRHDLVLFDLGPPEPSGAERPADGLQLRFHDYRRFGRLRLFPDDELRRQPGLAELGPEPLELTADDFVARCRRRARMIKPALLDQRFIAGIGNLYADEALHLSRIHPMRRTDTIARRKLIELHGHLQDLLRRSIDHEGTTIISFAGVDGRSGSFQTLLRVYGREGEPCSFCGHPIRRIRVGSRSSHLCPRCQRRR